MPEASSAEIHTPHPAKDGTRWWVHAGGLPTGPYATDELLFALCKGKIRPDTPACVVGGQEWRAVADWPIFATACATGLSFPQASDRNLHPVPRTVRWICTYLIFINPAV